MKKRVKLFTTIASLCLAVALMAFGVYAATQVTYTVNGSVSYSMTDVLVTVTTKLENVPTYKNKNATGATVGALKTEVGHTAETTKFVAVGQAQSFTTVNTDGAVDDTALQVTDGKGTITHEGFACNLNDSSVYLLTVTINVANDSGVTVTPKWTEPAGTDGWAIVEGDGIVSEEAKALAKGEHVLEFAIVLTDVTKTNITVNDLSFEFVMVQTPAQQG